MVVNAMLRVTVALCGRLLTQAITGEIGALNADRIIGRAV